MPEAKESQRPPADGQVVPAEVAAVVQKDAPDLVKLVRDLARNARHLATHLEPTLEKARERKFATSNGLGFLEVKYHTLLQYVMHLVFLVYLKLDRRQLKDHPAVDRLVELRVVLEKIKPMETRFKYQVDKLVKLALTAETEGEAAEVLAKAGMDGLQFKPNVHNFAAEEDMVPADEADGLPVFSASGALEEDQEQPRHGIYRPPKVAPVAYEEDLSQANRRQRQEARLAERAAKSRLMQELAAEFDDAPEEEAADGVAVISGHYDRDVERLRERDAYEEENFVRLTESKKDAKMRRRAGEKRLRDDLKNFSDFGSLASIREMERQAKGSFDLLRRRENRRRAAVAVSDEASGDEGIAAPRAKAPRKRRKKIMKKTKN